MDPSSATLIDPECIQRVVDIYETHPYIRMTRRVLKQHLFRFGLEVSRGPAGGKVPDAVMARVPERAWLELASRAVDWIICVGVVPVRVVDDPVTGLSIPRVLLHGTTTLHVRHEDEQQHFFVKTRSGEVDPKVVVYDGFGANPTVDGRLTSLMATIVPSIVLSAELHASLRRTEQVRSNPPIVTETVVDRGAQQEGAQYDFYADADTSTINAESCFRTDEVSMEQLDRRRDMLRDHLLGRETPSERVLENVVPLPANQKVSTTIMPNTRTDFTTIVQGIQNEICSAMGVPRSMLISDQYARTDVEGIHSIFENTIMAWSKTISNFMTRVYHQMYLEDELDARRRKRKRASPSAEEILTIGFPSVPFMSSDALFRLYATEVIDWPTYQTYARRRVNIPTPPRATPDPWTAEDRRALVFGARGASPSPAPAPPSP